jgi:hypothetical protein
MAAQTQLGMKVQAWTEVSKQDLRGDLNAIPTVPREVLTTIVDKVAKTSTACNVGELVALEAENNSISDWEALSAAVSAVSFVLSNLGDDAPRAVADELGSLLALSKGATSLLGELLQSAQPFREMARVSAAYLKVGAPLFVEMRGTVDLRMRFHSSAEEFTMGAAPSKVHGVMPAVIVNLTITKPGNDEESVVSFLMDESDLNYMKKFIRHMERELELAKGWLNVAEGKKNA